MTFPSRAYALGWLAGMIDGEGSVYIQTNPPGRVVKITSTEPALIEGVREALGLLDIPSTVYRKMPSNPRWLPIATVKINRRQDFEVLARDLQLLHPAKQDRLQSIPGTYTQHRYDRAVLEKLYLTERLSQSQIAARLGISKANVQFACRKFGLQIPASEAKRRGWTDERRVRQAESMRRNWEKRRTE